MEPFEKRSLIHGIVNLLLALSRIPIHFLQPLQWLPEPENPWVWIVPLFLLLFLPFLSDAAAIVIAAGRLQRSPGSTGVRIGFLLSVLSIPIYGFLRFFLHW